MSVLPHERLDGTPANESEAEAAVALGVGVVIHDFPAAMLADMATVGGAGAGVFVALSPDKGLGFRGLGFRVAGLGLRG